MFQTTSDDLLSTVLFSAPSLETVEILYTFFLDKSQEKCGWATSSYFRECLRSFGVLVLDPFLLPIRTECVVKVFNPSCA